MKYLPLRDFDEVTDALNFDTADCHVVGGCDVYTTKAAGADKKLYKNIEKSLESQYASVLSFSASLSTKQAEAAGPSLNLSRASPFGSLSQVSSRRTFAYLIATLNASHPDYDFSHLLRPSDFRREKSLKKVITTLDTTLYNLRPSTTASSNDPYTSNAGFDRRSPYGRDWSPDFTANTITGTPTRGTQEWNPRMWHLIDKEMLLKECGIYRYAPDDDPYDGEEGALWSFNYFFFNKARKRVCYLYLRGISIIETSSVSGLKTPNSAYTPLGAGLGGSARSKRCASGTWSVSSIETAQKRARYWLGDRADDVEAGTVTDGDDEEREHDENNEAEDDYEERVSTPVPRRPQSEKRAGGATHSHDANKEAADGHDDEAKEDEGRPSQFLALSSTDEAELEVENNADAEPGSGSESPCKDRGRQSKSDSQAQSRDIVVRAGPACTRERGRGRTIAV